MSTAIGTTEANTLAVVDSKEAQDALAKLGLVRDPKSEEARSILAEVGNHVPSDAQVKRAEGHVKSISGQLDAATEYRDGLVTYRNSAIIKAQKVGFSVTAICESLHISRGTVQNFANATKVREDLKAGGMVNPPAIATLYSEVNNLKPGELDAIRETARTTGALPPKGDPKVKTPATAKGVLSRAEGLSDALSSYVPKGADVDTLAQAVDVLTRALDKARAAHTASAAEFVADNAPDAEDYSTEAAAA
jgi:DNA-binding NarL/FixJ family response regulator